MHLGSHVQTQAAEPVYSLDGQCCALIFLCSTLRGRRGQISRWALLEWLAKRQRKGVGVRLPVDAKTHLGCGFSWEEARGGTSSGPPPRTLLIAHIFRHRYQSSSLGGGRQEAPTAQLLLQARQIVTNQPAAKSLAHDPVLAYAGALVYVLMSAFRLLCVCLCDYVGLAAA